MSNITVKEKEQLKKSESINATAKNVQQDIITPTGDDTRIIQPGVKTDFYTDEQTAYFMKIMETSKDKNEKLAIQVRDAVDGEWNIVSEVKEKKPLFTQKLPKAKKDRKWGSSENDAVKAAKSTFRNADLCTVREMASMGEYFKDPEAIEKIKDGAQDRPGDPNLMYWMEEAVLAELNPAMFTDDYLSQNMPKMFQYAKSFQKIDSFKEKYPKFYDSLPAEKKALAESRAHIGQEMEELLCLHMKKHGIAITEKKGETRLSLIREDPVKWKRHENRDIIASEYLGKLDDFLKKTLSILRSISQRPMWKVIPSWLKNSPKNSTRR